MKLAIENHSVQSTGILSDIEFSISAGPHVMQILSGLYTNPVDAMVREYLTNMIDAHVALRKINPLLDTMKPVVVLPSALTPTLEFRDNGIGMSAETVREIFTKYGASTKTSDNEFTGGFGLGSKVAFAYNGGSNWSVESRHGGEKHIFMACIGSNGVPTLKHVASNPTKEHSGVTIKIPVRREDVSAVKVAAAKYIPYFPLELEVQGDVVLPTLTWEFETPTFRAAKNHNSRNNTAVVVGPIPYDININDFMGYSDAHKNFFSYNTVDLFVEIGSVDIVPSRDALKLTDRTKARIRQAIANVIAEIPPLVAKQVANCATEYDALVAWRALRSLEGLDKICPKISYKGNEISLLDGITRKRADLKDAEFAVYGITSSDRATIEEKTGDSVQLTDTDKTFLVLNDVAKGGVSTCKAIVNSKLVHRNSNGRARRYGHSVGHAVLITTTKTPQQISDFFGGYPMDRMLKASDFKALPKATNGKKLSVENIYRWGTSWAARVNVPNDGVVRYYVPLVQQSGGGRWQYTDSYDQNGKMRMVDNFAAEMNIDIGINGIYGIRTADVSKFDATLWVNLIDACHAKARLMIDADPMMFAIVKENAPLNNLQNAFTKMFVNEKFETIDPLFAEYCEAAKLWRNDTKEYAKMAAMFRYLDTATVTKFSLLTKAVQVTKMPAIEQNMYAKYPMLEVVANIFKQSGGYYNSENMLLDQGETMLAYVRSVI